MPRDLAAVDLLLSRSYPRLLAADYPPSIIVMAIPLLARANPALLRSGTYLVAEDPSGAVLAAGGWTRTAAGSDSNTRDTGHVRHVATDPDHLRRGLATAIMSRAVAEAAAAGLRRLACLSTLTAVPFYGAMGFTTVSAVTIPLRPGITFPAISMLRELP